MKSKLWPKLILLPLMLIFVWLLYLQAQKFNQFLPSPLQSTLSRVNFKFKTLTANLVDAVYPRTYFHSFYRKDLLQFNLLMSSSDLNNLTAAAWQSVNQGYSDKQTTKSQPISLVYETNSYPAKIEFHGGGANDFVYNKLDYDIKLSGNKTINRFDSFTLFNPAVHGWITPLLANQVARELNLYYSDQFPVFIKINNRSSGIYLFEEKLNADFLTRHGLDQAQIIKLRDATRLPHRVNPVALNAHHLSGWDYEIANIDPLDQDSPETLFRLNQFFNAVKVQDLTQIIKFLDLDYWARYDAYRELFGADHDTSGDNLVLFYQPGAKQFYPVVRNEGDLNPLSLSGGTTLKSFNAYDPHLADQYGYPRLFLLLNRLPEFRILKYQYLYQLVAKQDQLQQNFTDIYRQYANVFIYDVSDEASVWQKQRLFKRYQQTLNANFSLISQELNFAQLAINVINDANQVRIEIIPDAVVSIKFDQFELEFSDQTVKSVTDLINQKTIIADFSRDFDLLPTTYTFNIPVVKPVTAIRVMAKNQITGQPISAVYSAVATPK